MSRVPLGSITHYDAPGENTQPPKLLLAVGHPPELAVQYRGGHAAVPLRVAAAAERGLGVE